MGERSIINKRVGYDFTFRILILSSINLRNFRELYSSRRIGYVSQNKDIRINLTIHYILTTTLIFRKRIMADNISLNFRIHDNTNDDEIFVIEISKEKKVDMLKPLVKKRLAPLANDIPSTQINLQTMGGMRMRAM